MCQAQTRMTLKQRNKIRPKDEHDYAEAATRSNELHLDPSQIKMLPPLIKKLDLEEMELLQETAEAIKEDQAEEKRINRLEAQELSQPGHHHHHHRRRHREGKHGHASAAALGRSQMSRLEIKTLKRARALGPLTSKLEIDQ